MKILKSLREYKKYTFLAPLFMILEVFVEIIIPLQMAQIIDVGIVNSDLSFISKKGFILILCAIVSLIFGILSGRMAAIAGAGFAKNLRKDIFYKIQTFNFENMDKFQVPSLVTRMTSDISNIQMSLMLSIRLLVRTVFMIILSMIMIYTINTKMFYILLSTIPFLSLMLFLIIRKAFPYYISSYKEYDELNKIVQENINASRVVKTYVRENFENLKFTNQSKKLFDLFKKAESYGALNNFIMPLTVYVVILLLLFNGGKNIVFGTMTNGELSSIIIYSIQILIALMMISFVFVMILISKAGFNRINEILNEENNMFISKNPIKEIKNGEIEFNNVYFSYKNSENYALKNISFKINSGAILGIIGSTGSSKSTLVHLLPRLYDINKGNIKIDGIDIKEYDLNTLRKEISIVLQKNQLFSGSIAENIRWGNPSASLEEVIENAKISQAHKFIETFPEKYDTIITQDGNNVSGGQKQRICIARALIKKPKILILDDSTSAIDTKTEALIRDGLKNSLKETTKIIISQKISSVKDSDVIIVLENGEINGIGNHFELLEKNEIYKDIYISQTREEEENEK